MGLTAGPASERVAENVRRLRTRAGLSTYALARELRSIGRPISPTSITRIEQAERRVDADDLVALAVVLNCSPNRLLMPALEEVAAQATVAVTSCAQADSADAWAWACGERPLIPLGGCGPSGAAEALFAVENQPHKHARRSR